MKDTQHQIAAGEFKAKCLQLMEQVNKTHIPLIITKRGEPIAKLVPVSEQALNLFGALKGSVNIHTDIISPIDETWDAETDE